MPLHLWLLLLTAGLTITCAQSCMLHRCRALLCRPALLLIRRRQRQALFFRAPLHLTPAQFPEADATYFIAPCYPYTYSDLQVRLHLACAERSCLHTPQHCSTGLRGHMLLCVGLCDLHGLCLHGLCLHGLRLHGLRGPCRLVWSCAAKGSSVRAHACVHHIQLCTWGHTFV